MHRSRMQQKVCDMRYVVHVVVIFAADESGSKHYDVWENTVILNAEGARDALEGGIRLSRQLLSNAAKLKSLGYPKEPVLYAVRSVDTDDGLPPGLASFAGESMRLAKVATINESEFEA